MYMPQDINFLRRLLEQGMAPEEAQAITPDPQNMLAQLLAQSEQMPQPNFDAAPMQQNTMRIENGPEAGKVVPLQFASAAPVSAGMKPPEKLGDPVDYMGRKGRYTIDGRAIVFPDGQKVVLNADEDFKRQKRDFDLAKSQQGLDLGQLQMRRGEADLAHQQEQTAALQAQRNVREDTTSQVYLQKKFGKPPKDMQWDETGRAVPIAGSPTELQANSAIAAGEDTLRKIDEMIGKRDEKGQLIGDSKPHPGFESAVGLSIPKALGAGLIPGTDTSNFNARLDEVKGGAFLEAFNSLKGGGAITEVEGKKATDAITRMRTSQSEDEFVKAALDFQSVVRRGIEKARAMGGRQQEQPAVTSADRARAVFDARKAIERGAPRAQVIQRLEQAGIRDHGL